MASMGPRQRCRGIEASLPPARAINWLQWGRGSAAAEFPYSTKGPYYFYPLQWGRGSAAAELRTGREFGN